MLFAEVNNVLQTSDSAALEVLQIGVEILFEVGSCGMMSTKENK